jgi:hypothetical protein
MAGGDFISVSARSCGIAGAGGATVGTATCGSGCATTRPTMGSGLSNASCAPPNTVALVGLVALIVLAVAETVSATAAAA